MKSFKNSYQSYKQRKRNDAEYFGLFAESDSDNEDEANQLYERLFLIDQSTEKKRLGKIKKSITYSYNDITCVICSCTFNITYVISRHISFLQYYIIILKSEQKS